ncbi:MAG TPA: hypothetical protein VNN25_13640 [Thermoanaerobaculia bacterium]|nr:hypothetical protein [Thermoanaerobaculia bacterium]
MDSALAPILAATGIVGLFSAASVLVIQLFRENGRVRDERGHEIKDLKNDVAALKAENLACKFQVNALVNMLRSNGIDLPDWLLRDGGHA